MQLVTLDSITKHHGAQLLFTDLSLTITAADRLGIIGPNGAGKSTLLRIIAGQTDIDAGAIIRKKDLRISYVEQIARFSDMEMAGLELAIEAAEKNPAAHDAQRDARTALSLFKIDYEHLPATSLSGGQRKRLQLALGFAASPDLLLLDEPTNHLDIDAIRILERVLRSQNIPWIAVTHDRWFLENSVAKILEVNSKYPGNYFEATGGYGDYLEERAELIEALQKQRSSLENKTRNEVAWLRQGVKARGTKSKHRAQNAIALMQELALVRARDNGGAVGLEFEASERKSKRLIEFENVSFGYSENSQILRNCTMSLVARQTVGILGLNGTGKTTLLKLLTGELPATSGTIWRAPTLSVAHFSQYDDWVAPSATLQSVLAPEGDSVHFRDTVIHVAAWASRFQFSFEQLPQPYDTLSGGEKARARLAVLMLQTPDVLILDEPTNDLDIETLELLEERLIDYPGACVLVTHDRFMINRVCTSFIGLSGDGSSSCYASYEQWEREQFTSKSREQGQGSSEKVSPEKANPATKKRLGYLEQRELDGMEDEIIKAEAHVAELQNQVAAAASHPDTLRALCQTLETAEQTVVRLYSRWEELQAKAESLK